MQYGEKIYTKYVHKEITPLLPLFNFSDGIKRLCKGGCSRQCLDSLLSFMAGNDMRRCAEGDCAIPVDKRLQDFRRFPLQQIELGVVE